MNARTSPDPVDFLLLGAGWTSQFLFPQLTSASITHAATTRTGHDSTIPFTFDPTSYSPDPYTVLPSASTILISFPITVPHATALLIDLYTQTHPSSDHEARRWIQLGSTEAWTGAGPQDRFSPVDIISSARTAEEARFLALTNSTSTPRTQTTVLNLAGLWGGLRSPANFVTRVLTSKAVMAEKTSLHLIHGEDVAAAIIAVFRAFEKASGERWILTDLRCYDWWDLGAAFGGAQRGTWVCELMREQGFVGLPRGREVLRRCLGSLEFWGDFGIVPRRCVLGERVPVREG